MFGVEVQAIEIYCSGRDKARQGHCTGKTGSKKWSKYYYLQSETGLQLVALSDISHYMYNVSGMYVSVRPTKIAVYLRLPRRITQHPTSAFATFWRRGLRTIL
jgi:hypothetical protein